MWSFFLTAFLVVVADQLSKLWITTNLQEGQVLFEAGIFQIVRIPRNSGAAFGLFQDQSFILTIVAFVGIALILVYAFIIRRQSSPLASLTARLALGLVLGGTVGNLIDRLRFGGVTDFISVGWWPVCNLADPAIVVGTILFAYLMLRTAQAEEH